MQCLRLKLTKKYSFQKIGFKNIDLRYLIASYLIDMKMKMNILFYILFNIL